MYVNLCCSVCNVVWLTLRKASGMFKNAPTRFKGSLVRPARTCPGQSYTILSEPNKCVLYIQLLWHLF